MAESVSPSIRTRVCYTHEVFYALWAFPIVSCNLPILLRTWNLWAPWNKTIWSQWLRMQQLSHYTVQAPGQHQMSGDTQTWLRRTLTLKSVNTTDCGLPQFHVPKSAICEYDLIPILGQDFGEISLLTNNMDQQPKPSKAGTPILSQLLFRVRDHLHIPTALPSWLVMMSF